MTLFIALQRQKIDLSALGLSFGAARSDYFCTPVGASVLFWTGVDGIHYCTVRGFDETIFVVDPSGVPGQYVHPVAENLRDFLRLVLACSGEAAIGQASRWSKDQFDTFLSEQMPDDTMQDTLTRLQNFESLTPMENPYDYIKSVQNGFPYRKLKFKPDYYEWAPEEPLVPVPPAWCVTFEGGFCEKPGRKRPGTELRLNQTFMWGNEIWHIPSVYLCGGGLVMDLCAEVDPVRFDAFAEKWKLYEDDTAEHLTEWEQAELAREHPLDIDFRAALTVNGVPLQQSHGYGMTWIPKLPEGFSHDLKTQWVLDRYGLDPTKCWMLRRLSFPWAAKHKPVCRTMQLSLRAEPVLLSAGMFSASSVGETIALTHPMTGEVYDLTVEHTEISEITASQNGDAYMNHPTKFLRMDYRITPEVSDLAVEIRDCNRGDMPRQKADAPAYLPTAVNSVGIILSGADGPTTVFVGGKGKLRAACSSLYFDVPQQIQWRVSFREVLRQNITVDLI